MVNVCTYVDYGNTHIWFMARRNKTSRNLYEIEWNKEKGIHGS